MSSLLLPKDGKGTIWKANLKKENNAGSFFIKAFRAYLLNVMDDVVYEDHLSE